MNIFRVKYCFSEIRARFLHKLQYQPTIYHLRSYLYSYLFSKVTKGKCITLYDQSNLKHPEINANALNNYFKWLKISPSSSQQKPIMMKQHKSHYVKQLKQLINKGDIYLCFCQKSSKAYDGKCRQLDNQSIQRLLKANVPYQVRLKQADNSLKYEDLIFGNLQQYPREDPAIQDPKLGFLNQFKAVVSDNILNVTHIFHNSSNLKELNEYLTISTVLYNKHPTIISLPPLLSTSVRSLTLQRLKSQQYEPEAIINFVGLLGWKPFGDSVSNILNQTRDYIFQIQDLIKYFDVDKISKQPVTYQTNKLKQLNKIYLQKNISTKVNKKNQNGIQEFRQKLNSLLGQDVMDTFNDDYLRKSLNIISKHMKKWSELKNYSFLFVPSFERNKPKMSQQLEIKINNNLVLILKHLIRPQQFSKESLGEKLSQFLQDFRREVSPEEFYRYFKYCICGQPNIKISALDIAEILGHQQLLSRFEQCQLELQNPESDNA